MKEIQLTKGFVTFVDDEDFDYVSQFKWHAKLYRGEPYAARSLYDAEAWQAGAPSHTKTVLMHRELMGASSTDLVDHKSRKTLDNQKDNLRICSRAQNNVNTKIQSSNTSGFKGVNWKKWDSGGGCWCARISVNFKRVHLGYFHDAKEAALAYDTAAIKHFGEFARVNFPNLLNVR